MCMFARAFAFGTIAWAGLHARAREVCGLGPRPGLLSERPFSWCARAGALFGLAAGRGVVAVGGWRIATA